MMTLVRTVLSSVLLVAAGTSACLAAPQSLPACAARTYALLDVVQFPADTRVQGTLFGGISGIDHAGDNRWVLISDDRSEHADARFYTATMRIDASGVSDVSIDRVVPLKDKDGRVYPAPGGEGFSVDAEAIRVDPRDGTLWWTSEGDAASGAPPSIGVVDLQGRWQRDVALPAGLVQRMDGPSGPRTNLAFEGLAWDTTGEALWVALEAPLHQDGPLASPDGGALVRFSLLQRDGTLLRQRAYRTDPVMPHDARMRADNGVSEILGLDDGGLLVLERSGVERPSGGFGFSTRLYCATVDEGSDVGELASLAGQAITEVPKKLVVDLDRVPGLPKANYEGMSWGPDLADGRRTLVLVSDNNFDAREATVIAVLAVGGVPQHGDLPAR